MNKRRMKQPAARFRSGADSASAPVDAARDTQIILALSAGLDVLDAMAAMSRPAGVADIARAIGESASMVQAVLTGLVSEGLVEVWDDGRYVLGAGAIRLGRTASTNVDIRDAARPLMRSLALSAGFNVGLGTRVGNDMVYCEISQGQAMVSLRISVGSRAPMLTSAMGRAYLAVAAPAERELLLDQARAGYSGVWGEARDAVDRAAQDVAEHGFCISVDDFQGGVNGVAAPLRDPEGKLHAVNLGGAARLLTPDALMSTYGPQVAALARAIEENCWAGGVSAQPGTSRRQAMTAGPPKP